MRQWYGYAAKVPAPKRASSPLCVSPTTFFVTETGGVSIVGGEKSVEFFCNGRLRHDGRHYAVGLVNNERYLLAEWDA